MEPIFAGYRISERTKDSLETLSKLLNISKPLNRDDYHVTLLTSEKPVKYFKIKKEMELITLMSYKLIKIDNSLALLLDSEDIIKRHNELKESFKTIDYFPYLPHITISYRYFHVPPILKEPIKIELIQEYYEALNMEFHLKYI